VRLDGIALHAGARTSVTLSRAPGPIRLAQRGAEATLAELVPLRTDRGVRLGTRDGRIAVDLCEHLLAALGGLGVRGGVRVATDDDELPLLDGGARRFVEALDAIGARDEAAAPSLRITRAAAFEHEASVYRFAPDGGVRLAVDVRFPPPLGAQAARWDGDPADFAERIAPARTFGWAREHAALLAAGRARGVDLDAVLVLDDAGPVPGCRPPAPSEPARHKLLDLVGDLALYGGPPEGSLEAVRPGHGATHRIVALALEAGVLSRSRA
jgi:UDP-3-O-[3-hydroxymyristoyl] N-acetylglucosamine deacetylase